MTNPLDQAKEMLAKELLGDNAQEPQHLHYWVVKTTVYYMMGKLEKSRGVNVMVNGSYPALNIMKLSEIQAMAHKVFLKRYMVEERFTGARIVDVTIDGMMYLGYMTDAEMQEGTSADEEPAA